MSEHGIAISLLDLPPEIRFQIYGHTTRLQARSFSPYKGLYPSCHQVKAEMDDECGKILKALLESVQAKMAWNVPIQLMIPNDATFCWLRNPRVSFSGDIGNYGQVNWKLHEHQRFSLRHIFHLRLDSLTIIVPEGDSHRTLSYLVYLLSESAVLGPRYCNTGRLFIEVEQDLTPEHALLWWRTNYESARSKMWNVKYNVKENPEAHKIIFRRGKTWTVELYNLATQCPAYYR